MSLPTATLLLLQAGTATPAAPPTQVVAPAETGHRLPVEVLTELSSAGHAQPDWDYGRDPWPPCSFG